jgi:chromosomal replication initiator protein
MHLKLWTDLLQLLEANMRREAIILWVFPLQPILISDEKLVLKVPNGLHQRIIEERYLRIILRCLRALTGKRPDIDFVVDREGELPIPDKPIRLPGRRTGVRRAATNLNRNYTFDNFVVGRCNRAAYSAAVSIERKPGKKHNPLFITGGVGLGKTHLLQAIGAQTLAHRKHSFLYIPSDLLMDELMESYKNGTIIRSRRKFTSPVILLVDDVHFLSGKNQIQEEFFQIFNMLYRKKCQIVLSSDRPPGVITRLQKRLVSRFQCGSILELKPPDLTTRTSILEHKSRQLGMSLSRKTLLLLASRIRTNIRRMEGALHRIAAHCKLTGLEPDYELVEGILGDGLFEGERDTISIRSIQQRVVHYFNIRMADLLKHTRIRSASFPRQMAMYLCRKLLNSSHADIGAAFSGRNHATVIHACRTIELLMRESSEAREVMDELVTAIRS